LPGRRYKKLSTQSGSECYRCGRRGHFARDLQCLARGKTCTKCSQVGHFANVSITKFLATPGKSDVRYMQEDACGGGGGGADGYVFAIGGGNHGGKVVVNVGGVPVEMIIDSGASANVISQVTWEKLKKCHIKRVSQQNTKKLYAYGTVSPLDVIGTFTANITTMGNNVCQLKSRLKQKLTQAETLGYFDRSAKTKIIADAGPVGFGQS